MCEKTAESWAFWALLLFAWAKSAACCWEAAAAAAEDDGARGFGGIVVVYNSPIVGAIIVSMPNREARLECEEKKSSMEERTCVP